MEERVKIRAVQMDILRLLLGIRRMNKVTNAQSYGLCDGSAIMKEWEMKGLLKE